MLRVIALITVVCFALGVVVLAGFMFFAGGAAWMIGSHAQADTSAADPGTYARTVKARAASRVAQVGETVHVGYWSYRINGARMQPAIVAELGRLERPEGQFIVLDLNVRNNDRTESLLPPVKLVDEQGREFSESTAGTFSPGVFVPLKELNPGMESRGLLVFDVLPGHTYRALLSGGIQSGANVIAQIGATTPPQAEAHRPSSEASDVPQPQLRLVRNFGGIEYQQVNGEWIRLDMDEVCGTPDPQTGGYPQVCILKENQ